MSAGAAMRREHGFSYIGVILLLAGFSIALAATGELWSTLARREREAELFAVGQAYQRAIQSYHAASRPGSRPLPTRLEDLLEDRRQGQLLRHLRKLYVDPITASTDWGLIRAPDGSITGIHSRSTDRPRRTAFDPPYEAFAKAETYADWRFEFKPSQRPGLPAAPPKP